MRPRVVISIAVALFAIVTLGRAEGAPARDVLLIEAAKRPDAAAVRALLQQHVDVNAAEGDGTTALHWAAHRDDLVSAGLLIRAGARVDAANRYGVTPLALASVNGSAAMIELLLKAGANPNLAQPEGEAPLLTAALTGNVAAVRMLLEHGADVKAKESRGGQDALMWAAAEGHASTVQTLLEHGAEVDARSAGKYTALMFAAREGDIDTIKVLLAAGADVNATESAGASALMMAIHNAHYELAALLLDKGADVNVSTSGYTPLHLAIQIRNPDYEKFYRPVQTGHLNSLDFIKLLLTRGADPNAQMTKPFIVLGSPLDVPLPGATPFWLAAKGADPVVMRLLLERGADPLVATTGKTTPLMAAAGVGYEQGKSPGSEAEALEAVKLCVELGADVNAGNAIGFTALHGAVIRGANSIVQFLVDKGARLEAKDKRGRTPLTIAELGAGDSTQRRQLHTAELLRQLMSGSR